MVMVLNIFTADSKRMPGYGCLSKRFKPLHSWVSQTCRDNHNYKVGYPEEKLRTKF